MATLRTTSPSASNKNFINTAYGGYNRCIAITKGGSCLPNCTGYCWGAWREMLGESPKLSTNNAERWFGMNKAYKTGTTPKLGAVICYRGGDKVDVNGSDGAGHVAIVVGIGEGHKLTVAQSNYGGNRFEVVTYDDYRYIQSDLHFQGFIYYPDDVEGGTDEGGSSDGDEGGTKKKETKGTLQDTYIIKALEVLYGKYGNGINRKKALGKDYEQVQVLVNRLICTYSLYQRLAMQVWIGLWGNGASRKLALTKAGYNYYKVQEQVKKFNKTKKVLSY